MYVDDDVDVDDVDGDDVGDVDVVDVGDVDDVDVVDVVDDDADDDDDVDEMREQIVIRLPKRTTRGISQNIGPAQSKRTFPGSTSVLAVSLYLNMLFWHQVYVVSDVSNISIFGGVFHFDRLHLPLRTNLQILQRNVLVRFKSMTQSGARWSPGAVDQAAESGPSGKIMENNG